MSVKKVSITIEPSHKQVLERLALERLGTSNISLLMRNIADGRITISGDTSPDLALRAELTDLRDSLRATLATIDRILDI